MKFKNKEEARVWAHFAGMLATNSSVLGFSELADTLLSAYRERQESPPVRETHVWMPREEWNAMHLAAARWAKLYDRANWRRGDPSTETLDANAVRAEIRAVANLIPG